MQREVFGPLGMSDTGFNPPASQIDRIPPTEQDDLFRHRLVRGEVLSLRSREYVQAAIVTGQTTFTILRREVLPNTLSPIVVLASLMVATAILLESSLSFLGLGVAEPKPAWGLMLSGTSANFYQEAPWMILFPGLAISLAVFAFNLFGDALRDWLDPKLKT